MSALKRYWAWQKHPFASFVTGGGAGFVVTKFELVSLLLGVL